MPDPIQPDRIQITIDGKPQTIEAGTIVAVAIAVAGLPCRTSVSGQPRGPLCAMGICFECRATINGIAHRRTCQIVCEPGMKILTQ